MIRFLLGLMILVSIPLWAQPRNGQGKGMMAVDHFKSMDTDSDKKVSKEEWQKFHDDFFQELDQDGDGLLTFDELKAKRASQRDKMKDKTRGNPKK